jgi:hypothetical protein
VAIRAPNDALRDFRFQTLQAQASACQVGHVSILGANVIEVQDDKSRVTAADTPRLHQ